MNNLRGSLLMVAAMAAFSLEDLFIKSATTSLPLGQVLILFGLGGMIVFMILTARRGEVLLHPAILSRPIILRSICEVTGRICFTLALALTPLSSASAILQATPLIVIIGAVIFFGETVGWRRWLAILIGLGGVLLILRPGLSGFEPASLFAVLGTLGFAGRDLATRAAPQSMSNMQLGVWGFFMLVVAGCLMLNWTGGIIWPGANNLLQIAGAIIFGVIAYNALTIAMRSGEISVVAPFRYTRLVFAMVLGVVIFAERPDSLTLLCSAIVVGCGLYSVFRERRLQQTATS
ncbi:DMT family transporter [Pararhizobium sp. IMCC21322]|uniref:DMT family transporter n=1 Tax=Pararhizobium sp. IMCC21322 TaxID=3067903 RepID=UPI002741238B|nr:DMT family transporter [Pararhizobium sp. IMCC21322]